METIIPVIQESDINAAYRSNGKFLKDLGIVHGGTSYRPTNPSKVVRTSLEDN